MDYSLLLAINKCEKDDLLYDEYKDSNNTVFKILIIDILQQYTLKKKFEHFYKVYIKQLDKNGISSVNAKQYYDRFIKRVVQQIFYL